MVLFAEGRGSAREMHNSEVHSAVSLACRLFACWATGNIPREPGAFTKEYFAARLNTCQFAARCSQFLTDLGPCGARRRRPLVLGEFGGLLLPCNNRKGDRTPKKRDEASAPAASLRCIRQAINGD